MASNPPCMSEDGNAAIFVGTNFETGDSVTLCPTCLVSWCATIVEGLTGVPVSALIDAAQSGELELVTEVPVETPTAGDDETPTDDTADDTADDKDSAPTSDQ